MKAIHKLSLRLRVTLLTGAMVLVTSLTLTAVSMTNANGQIVELKRAVEAATISPADMSDVAITVTTTPAEEIPVGDGQMTSAVFTIEASKATTRFNYLSILALIVVAGAGMGLSYYIAGRALRPVRRLSEAANAIGAHSLETRLPDCETGDEIGGLTRAFNGMLDRLQGAFETQRRFSSNVAHELKTPLATMKLCVQTARLEGEGNVEFLDVTERAVDRLSGVVSDLLLLTNEGDTDFSEEIALPAMLREAAEELSRVYQAKAIRVEYDFPDEALMVHGNRGLSRHLLRNLIENGMKYNREGGTLRLRAARTAGGVCLTVSDTGPGIPPEALPHIFEPFYCADPSRSRRLGGAGLGLSIARTIATRQGWSIQAQSTPGSGAVFTILIDDEHAARVLDPLA